MRKRFIIAASLATGVVISALIAAPSLAAGQRGDDAARPDPGRTSEHQGRDAAGARPAGHEGTGMGSRKGMGTGMNEGMNDGKGTGTGLTDLASGSLTAEQTAALSAMADEEKLAHDLYLAFADQYDARVFTRVASAETRHLDAVRVLLERYDVADPTVGLATGVFSTDVTQDLYDSLLTEGSVSLDAAMKAARTVEELDIAGLTAATEGVTAPDVLVVYENLLRGSEHHLVAFGG